MTLTFGVGSRFGDSSPFSAPEDIESPLPWNRRLVLCSIPRIIAYVPRSVAAGHERGPCARPGPVRRRTPERERFGGGSRPLRLPRRGGRTPGGPATVRLRHPRRGGSSG